MKGSVEVRPSRARGDVPALPAALPVTILLLVILSGLFHTLFRSNLQATTFRTSLQPTSLDDDLDSSACDLCPRLPHFCSVLFVRAFLAASDRSGAARRRN